jgi:hypothetical protein
MPFSGRWRGFANMSELTGGIENAIERGESAQRIKQSFLNAGYKNEDIEEAFKEAVQYGLISEPQTLEPSANVTPSADETNYDFPQPALKELPPSLPKTMPAKSKKRLYKVLIVILIILVLLLITSSISFLVFKDQIYDFLRNYLT